MASSSAPAETESAICPVCKDTPQDVRVLPCKHQVCAHCLQQHISASTMTDNRFQCPECRVECKLLGRGIVHKVNKRPFHSSTEAPCTNGCLGLATVFCTDCDKFYCETCSSNHRSSTLFSGHNIRSIDEVTHGSAPSRSTSRDSASKKHKHEELSTYCITCQRCIFTSSATKEHEEHWLQDLVEAGMAAQRQLEDMTATAVRYTVEQDDALEEVMQTKEHATASMKTARDGIKKAAQQARDIINDHEKRVLRDITRHETKVLNKLEAVRRDRESKKASAEVFRQEAENLCESGKAVDMIKQKPLFEEKLNAMKMSKHENITWDFEKKQQIQKSLKVMLGNVKLNSTGVLSPGRITLGECLHQITLTNNNKVTGLIAMGNCLCFMHADDLRLWIYNMEAGYIKTCEDLELKSPNGMALLQPVDRTVVIADPGKLHFVKISTDLEVTRLRVKATSVSQPGSVSVSRQTGEIIIGRKDSLQFVIYNHKGDTQREIQFSADWTTICTCAVHGKDGYGVLMKSKFDSTGNSIDWQDEKGRVCRKYHKEDGETISVDADHMIMDREGRLIFANTSDHKVHLVNTHGCLSQFLLTQEDGIRNPEYVYLDEDSARLYVVHHPVAYSSREVRVYTWSPKSGDVLTTNYKLDAELNKFQYEV